MNVRKEIHGAFVYVCGMTKENSRDSVWFNKRASNFPPQFLCLNVAFIMLPLLFLAHQLDYELKAKSFMFYVCYNVNFYQEF